MPKKIVLTQPIRAHGVEMSTLDLREPRPDDVWDLDLKLGQQGGLTLVYGQLLTFAGRLADIPPSSLRALAPVDCGQMAEAALPFLLPFLGGGSSPSES